MWELFETICALVLDCLMKSPCTAKKRNKLLLAAALAGLLAISLVDNPVSRVSSWQEYFYEDGGLEATL